MTVTEWLKINDDTNNIFAPPMKSQVAINILKDYLLGEDWYTVNPISQEQVNTEIVITILEKYSKKFRREKRSGIARK